MVFAVTLHADTRMLEPGAVTELDVNVFGHGNRYVAYLVQALAQAGASGIGKRRGALRLTGVLQHDAAGWQPIRAADGSLSPRAPIVPEVPAMPARVRMTLTTPLRLRVADSYLGPQNFQVDALLIGLLRRISQLVAHHTDAPLATDFRALKSAAASVVMPGSALRWHEMARWSARQQALLQNGGLLGELLFDGTALEPFWPLLWLGQWTHAGKNAAMGLGRYELSAG